MGLPLMILGVVGQAFGKYQEGKSLQEQAETEKEILDHNAGIKDREAKLALERSRAKALQFEEEGDQLLAAQNVAIAKGGVLASSGTPSLLMEVTADTLDQDRRSILRDGFVNQSFLQSQAENLRYQGRAARARGENIRTASYINVATSLLSGFTRISQAMGSFGGGGNGTVGGQPRSQDLWQYRRENPGSGSGGVNTSGGSHGAFGGSSGGSGS